MRILELARWRTAAAILRQRGLHGILSVVGANYISPIVRALHARLPVHRSPKGRWKAGISSELAFWDDYFRTKGLQWPESYSSRLREDLPLQARPAALIPSENAHVLDVGAGPLTYLGKTHNGKPVKITAVDPLAERYDRIMAKYGVTPVIRTQQLAAEELSQRFLPNTFDLAFARNCIDHSYDPVEAIKQMLAVVKPGGFVLLEHVENEGKNGNYNGLHQWNFSRSSQGEFIVGSQWNSINVTDELAAMCEITCELTSDEGRNGDWLVVTMRKM